MTLNDYECDARHACCPLSATVKKTRSGRLKNKFPSLMQVKNPRAGILHQPNQPNENSRAEKSHMGAKCQSIQELQLLVFSHLANALSRILSDCPRSKLPRVIIRRLGGLSVHEPLPSCELTESGTDRAFAAFQRPRASFNIHKNMATIMHYKQVSTTHTIYSAIDYTHH